MLGGGNFWNNRKHGSKVPVMQKILIAEFLNVCHSQGMEWNGRRFFYNPYWQFSSIRFPFHTKIFFIILFRISIPS